jgi:hypothetical protein
MENTSIKREFDGDFNGGISKTRYLTDEKV